LGGDMVGKKSFVFLKLLYKKRKDALRYFPIII